MRLKSLSQIHRASQQHTRASGVGLTPDLTPLTGLVALSPPFELSSRLSLPGCFSCLEAKEQPRG